MKFKVLEDSFKYDGSQLRSLFAYRTYHLLGNSLICWQGPCDVSPENMVDGEDLNLGEEIRGDFMLHFILEKFNTPLETGVYLQRLMSSLALETLRLLSSKQDMANQLVRRGDDIFFNSKKLNISIATVSPVSALIHLAFNISNEGTPVETLSLGDLDIEPLEFAKILGEKIIDEIEEVSLATNKVHWVK